MKRIKGSRSRVRVAKAVQCLLTDHGLTQTKVAQVAGKSLGWVNALARWDMTTQASPWPTTRAERIQRVEKSRYRKRARKRREEGGSRKTKSDWPALTRKGRSASLLPYDHPAVEEARTIYPTTVQMDSAVLKPGNYQWKLGGEILKGDWRGFPVFSLTLEERATCPVSCKHWRSCFGNRMHLAHRMPHGEDLEQRLRLEVAQLAAEHTNGFAIRLHVLGDFYSPGYVAVWRQLLDHHPELHIWGYTARIDVTSDPIAAALVELAQDQPERFAMRFSNAPPSLGVAATISIEHPKQLPPDATVCPQETDKTESCSNCALCWSPAHRTARVAFIQH
ncbi:GP88 family protein [Bradyrhizobium genosp. P]|uniref:GP88 family protein n=1 Tax=Bradyrhizobium genosp. P TaxID=83641 RepID=UPI003CEE180F